MTHYVLSTLQKLAVAKLWSRFNAGEKSVLGVMCTGGGKTVVGMAFIKEWLEANPGCNVQIIVPAVALVEQFHETAANFGISASVYHGELTHRTTKTGKKIAMPYLASARINISLPDTFSALLGGDNKYGFDFSWKPNLIVFDEAHKNTSLNSFLIREFWKDVFVLGLTATPRRETNVTDCEFLWNWYDEPEILATPTDLLNEGRIVDPVFMNYQNSDESLFEIWSNVTNGVSNKSSIIVTSGGDNSLIAIYEVFRKKGIAVQYLTSVELRDINDKIIVSAQSPKQRQKIQADFRHGKFDVLVSVDTICEGFDAPCAKYVFVNRSITAEALWHQVCGRVLRAHTYDNGEVKQNGYIIDLADNFKRYGSITDKNWTKADYAPASNITVRRNDCVNMGDLKGRNKKMFVACECTNVYDVISNNFTCPHCSAPSDITVHVDVRDFIRKCYGIESSNFGVSRAWAEKVFSNKVDYTVPNVSGYAMSPKARAERMALNEALGVVFINPENGKTKKAHRILTNILFGKKDDGSKFVLDDRIQVKVNDLNDELFSKLKD